MRKKLLLLLFIFVIWINGCLQQESKEKVSEDFVQEDNKSILPQEKYTPLEESIVQSEKNIPQQSFPLGGCKNEPVTFRISPLRLEDIQYIEPMGAMRGEHVTPTDHQYWRPPPWSEDPRPREVFAPAEGIITNIQRLHFQPDPNAPPTATDYRLEIEHSCTISTVFIHITELSEKIEEELGEIPATGYYSAGAIRIPVNEGEVIGTIYGTGGFHDIYQIDFNVVNKEIKLNFVNPSSYEGDPWKIHIDEPFKYFNKELRQQLLAKNLRSVEPLGGKIDYDVDGRLVGNWFKEGTGGYSANDLAGRYWIGHLTFAYNDIDPEHIMVSMGDFEEGKTGQFGVKGNKPDPADVSVATGIIKYELVRFDYYLGNSNQRWDRRSFANNIKERNTDNNVEGVMLVQMIKTRKIKFETFPGKTASQVSDFTENAKIYER